MFNVFRLFLSSSYMMANTSLADYDVWIWNSSTRFNISHFELVLALSLKSYFQFSKTYYYSNIVYHDGMECSRQRQYDNVTSSNVTLYIRPIRASRLPWRRIIIFACRLPWFISLDESLSYSKPGSSFGAFLNYTVDIEVEIATRIERTLETAPDNDLFTQHRSRTVSRSSAQRSRRNHPISVKSNIHDIVWADWSERSNKCHTPTASTCFGVHLWHLEPDAIQQIPAQFIHDGEARLQAFDVEAASTTSYHLDPVWIRDHLNIVFCPWSRCLHLCWLMNADPRATDGYCCTLSDQHCSSVTAINCVIVVHRVACFSSIRLRQSKATRAGMPAILVTPLAICNEQTGWFLVCLARHVSRRRSLVYTGFGRTQFKLATMTYSAASAAV